MKAENIDLVRAYQGKFEENVHREKNIPVSRDFREFQGSFIFFGMLFGGPLLAFFSKKFGNYTVITTCGVGMAFLFTFLLFNTTYNCWMLSCLFFCIGIMCCYQVIVFAAGADLVTPQYLGVTVAFLNCINIVL